MSAAGAPGRRLLLFNLVADVDDPILGFTHEWIRALARRVERVDVVTMRAGRLDLPTNVRVFSVGKELGYSEPRRALEFYRIAARLGWFAGYDACFAHMNTLFAAMAAPILRFRRVPITLWYTHRATSIVLRLAVSVSRTVITAAPDSINVSSRKVVATGHGVDTGTFAPDGVALDPSLRVLFVGRIAPIKNLEVLVDAASLLRDAVAPAGLRVTIAGPLEPANAEYGAALVRRIQRAGLAEVVDLPGAVRRDRLPQLLRDASVVVNLSPKGLFDKVSLESMSCGTPIVTTNPSFHALLDAAGAGDLVVDDSPAAVSAAVCHVASLEPDRRAELGRRLRGVVVEHHSLDRLADRLVQEILF